MTDIIKFHIAKSLANKLLGKTCTKVDRGRNNWVFENKNSILTIPRHERVKDYRLRVAANRMLDSHGIPVVKIMEYHEKSKETLEYLIVKKLDGEHSNLETRTEKERDSIHQSSGEVLKAIHQIQGQEYGRLDENLIGTKPDWGSFIDWFFYSSLKRVESVPDLKSEYSDMLRNEYESTKEIAKNFSSPSILHADFHMDNLFYKNDKVLAVLDLDIMSSGNPNWDTGHYCHTFNYDRKNGVKSFRKGYGQETNSKHERLYCLSIWTRKLGSQGQNRRGALKETIPELKRILNEKV